MRDSDVRALMRAWLTAHYAHDSSSRFVEEMCVWNGSARIDMAVINGQLHGYEIKSERDTLGRLDDQMELYNQVFDQITLVAADKHLTKAAERVPQWWGLTAVQKDDDAESHLKLNAIREPRRNPSIDKVQIARLLWKPELIAILESVGLAKGVRSKSVDHLCRLIAGALDERALSAHVRASLKARHGWLGQHCSNVREMTARAD
ncbi:MAG: sce7726 family protein [Xanthobacteraceae bacterium]|nr:sce7726 family protein [Xanthobacteraceae bacterium]